MSYEIDELGERDRSGWSNLLIASRYTRVNINTVEHNIKDFIHNIQNLNSSSDSCNNFSISTSSENHALLETPSIEEQLEMGNSSYE